RKQAALHDRMAPICRGLQMKVNMIKQIEKLTHAFVFTFAVGSMAFNCAGPPRVKIPATESTLPTIEMSNIDIGGTTIPTPAIVKSKDGATQSVGVTSSAGKCQVPQLFVLGSATDTGGARSLRVVITENGGTIYDATTKQDPDANNT